MKKQRSSFEEKVENFLKVTHTAGGRPQLKPRSVWFRSTYLELIYYSVSSSVPESRTPLATSTPAKRGCSQAQTTPSHWPFSMSLSRTYMQSPNQVTTPPAHLCPCPQAPWEWAQGISPLPFPDKLRDPRSFICPCNSTLKNSNAIHCSSPNFFNHHPNLLFPLAPWSPTTL